MSIPSDEKMEAFEMDGEIHDDGLISSSTKPESQVDELCYLSGDKPFFDVVLSKSHIESPYCLRVPVHIVPMFPSGDIPVVLIHGGKEWHVLLIRNGKRSFFRYSDWKKFAADNNLKTGDACIFEVMDCSSDVVILRVVILRNTEALPSDLKGTGDSLETAIELD